MSKVSNYSENEDDPEVYESSGDEWKASKEKTNNRRTSQRLIKKPRVALVDEDSGSPTHSAGMSTTSDDMLDEEEEEDEDIGDSSDSDVPRKRKHKNGLNKKEGSSPSDNSKNSSKSNPDTTSPSSDSAKPVPAVAVPVSRGIHRKFIPKTIYSEDYATGSFVILKKDAQVGDPSKHPCIWRIDGKALLQKYEAFDEDGKVRHKNTSIYTGWSPMDKDLYAPITVDVIHHNNQNLTVELHWDKLKEINMDSD